MANEVQPKIVRRTTTTVEEFIEGDAASLAGIDDEDANLGELDEDAEEAEEAPAPKAKPLSGRRGR